MIKYLVEGQTNEEGVTTWKAGMSGHANYAEIGKSIVCAAASVLAQILANELEKAGAEDLYLRLEPGDIMISCKSSKHDTQIRSYFDFVSEGMDLLAETYPENVDVDIELFD